MVRPVTFVCAVVVVACGKTSVATQAPPDAETDAAASATTVATAVPTVPPVLAPSAADPAEPAADAGIALPRKVIANSPCGSGSVPLCFPTRPSGCCEPTATFAVCGARRIAGIGVWECPRGTVAGRECPPACAPDVRAALVAEEERELAKYRPSAAPSLPGAYAIREHAYASRASFESISHFMTLFHGDEPLTIEVDHVAVEPKGRAATYCDREGTTFLHVASKKKVTPIAPRTGCAYAVTWDVDRQSVTLAFGTKKRVTSTYE